MFTASISNANLVLHNGFHVVVISPFYFSSSSFIMPTVNNPDNHSSVAFNPSAPELVPGLLEQIASSGQAFLSSDPKARSELLEAARSLVYALETPREAMARYCWYQVISICSPKSQADEFQ